MKKDYALLVLADPGRWPIRLRSGLAWAILFQAVGLNGGAVLRPCSGRPESRRGRDREAAFKRGPEMPEIGTCPPNIISRRDKMPGQAIRRVSAALRQTGRRCRLEVLSFERVSAESEKPKSVVPRTEISSMSPEFPSPEFPEFPGANRETIPLKALAHEQCMSYGLLGGITL